MQTIKVCIYLGLIRYTSHMRQRNIILLALFFIGIVQAQGQFYNITTIPYNPAPFTGISLTGSFSAADDGSTGAIPLPFEFCFFGNTYTECYVGTNGWLSFSPNQPNTFTSNSIPSALAGVPKNCIMAPWQDWWSTFGGFGNIQYATFGVAPFRRFVVTFFQVPLFSCTGSLGTFQIILNECNNDIEVHILEKPPCSWAQGTAVLGVHNATGTVANTPTGRNSTVWTVTPANPEGWLFRPVGFCEAVSFGGFVSADTTSRLPVVETTCYNGVFGLKAKDGTLQCNSITADGSDFRLYDPKGNLMQIRAVNSNCVNGRSDSITIFSSVDFLFNGDHYLVVRNGTDGDALVGDCGTGSNPFDTIIIRVSGCFEYDEPIHMRNVSVTPDNTGVDLTWSYPANGFDPAFFENYRIYYKDATVDTARWNLFIDTDDVNDTTFSTGVINPEIQNASFRAFLRLRFYGDIRTPGDSVENILAKPADDRLTNGTRGIAQINWNPYDGWNSPTYEIYLKSATDTGFGQLLASTTDTNYIFEKPIELGKYTIRVRTVNVPLGFVAWSNFIPFEMVLREVEVPNVITPNGDGANDVFKVKGIEFFPENTVQLFNRWGQKVWEGIDYQNTYTPTNLEGGVYIYKIVIPDQPVKEGAIRIIK